MKWFVTALVLVSGYFLALISMTDLVLQQATGLHSQYERAASVGEAWSQGDTSQSFVSNR